MAEPTISPRTSPPTQVAPPTPSAVTVQNRPGAAAILSGAEGSVFAYSRNSGQGLAQDIATLRGMRVILDRYPTARLAVPGEHKSWDQALTGDAARARIDQMLRERGIPDTYQTVPGGGSKPAQLPKLPPP